MTDHTIHVEIDKTCKGEFTDPKTCLAITDEKGCHGRHKRIKLNKSLKWCTNSKALKVEFENKVSPFTSDPPFTHNQEVTVRKDPNLKSCYKYTVTVTDSNGEEIPEDPQIMIDPGLSDLNWFLLSLSALGIGITVWALSKLWASSRSD